MHPQTRPFWMRSLFKNHSRRVFQGLCRPASGLHLPPPPLRRPPSRRRRPPRDRLSGARFRAPPRSGGQDDQPGLSQADPPPPGRHPPAVQLCGLLRLLPDVRELRAVLPAQVQPGRVPVRIRWVPGAGGLPGAADVTAGRVLPSQGVPVRTNPPSKKELDMR
jgi:hypothetical protein